MTGPRDPFSWDGEDEPIPLHDLPGGEASLEVLIVAEDVVRDAQESIARQDTDPTLDLPSLRGQVNSSFPGESGTFAARIDRALPRRAVLALLAGCLLAFAHGWHVGARAAGIGECGPRHCSYDSHVEKWKEEDDR